MASLLVGSLIIVALSINPVSSKLVLEEGYTVSTVVDFNKFSSPPASGVYPYAIVPLRSSQDLVLLDHTGSTFYTLSLPSLENNEAEIKHLSGNGKVGFLDGDAKVASFNKPRSFAVDDAGNVYVADRINNVTRKINPSGFTTTIAGGYSRKVGNTDGPAQNASFSNDFELVYMHKKCALLVVDRGTRLIRQINLNSKDCTHKAPQSGLGAALVTVIAIASLLLGSILGFVARPFINFHAGTLGRPASRHDTEAAPNQSGENNTDQLLRHQKRIASPSESGSCSLMDLDVVPVPTLSEKNDSLKELMCLDTDVSNVFCKQGDRVDAYIRGTGTGNSNRLDEMILTHLSEFSCQTKPQGVLEESTMSGSRLVRRRSAVET